MPVRVRVRVKTYRERLTICEVGQGMVRKTCKCPNWGSNLVCLRVSVGTAGHCRVQDRVLGDHSQGSCYGWSPGEARVKARS